MRRVTVVDFEREIVTKYKLEIILAGGWINEILKKILVNAYISHP